jgi:N-glycosylase/DNA lyase
MMIRISKEEFTGPFELSITMASDQCPTDEWRCYGDVYKTHLRVGDEWILIELRERKGDLVVKAASDVRDELLYHFWHDYDLPEFYKRYANDPYLFQAIGACHGLRVMRYLDLSYAIIAALLTQNAPVDRIRLMKSKLKRFYGDGHGFDLRKLAKATEEKLRICGVGYRASYLIDLARAMLKNELCVEELRHASTIRARKLLMRFDGIGPKVADIILLYGFGRPDAFPMDRWIKEALIREYFQGKRASDGKLREFAHRYFGKHAGIAHLYMFAFERKMRSCQLWA